LGHETERHRAIGSCFRSSSKRGEKKPMILGEQTAK